MSKTVLISMRCAWAGGRGEHADCQVQVGPGQLCRASCGVPASRLAPPCCQKSCKFEGLDAAIRYCGVAKLPQHRAVRHVCGFAHARLDWGMASLCYVLALVLLLHSPHSFMLWYITQHSLTSLSLHGTTDGWLQKEVAPLPPALL